MIAPVEFNVHSCRGITIAKEPLNSFVRHKGPCEPLSIVKQGPGPHAE
jgi:hypothetical protein